MDEAPGVLLRVLRLFRGRVEELDEVDAKSVVKIGEEAELDEEGNPIKRADMKTRSQEPDLGALIESDFNDTEDEWYVTTLSRRIPWGWVGLVMMIFGGAIIWSLIQVQQSSGRRIAASENAAALVKAEEQKVIDAEVTLETLERATRDFFDSRSVEALLKCVRQPERVKPLMEEYYADAPPKFSPVSEMITLDPVTYENRGNLWAASCILENGRQAQVLVEVYSEEVAKVDWETYVVYQPIPWGEFATNHEGGYTGDFRVFAALDFYFSHEFADSEKFACVRLTSLDSPEVMYGYMDKESATWARIKEQIDEGGGAPSPLLLRLHVPENYKSPHGVIIEEMLAPGWLLVEDPEKR